MFTAPKIRDAPPARPQSPTSREDVGIALGDPAIAAQKLPARADAAMYGARRAGKGRRGLDARAAEAVG